MELDEVHDGHQGLAELNQGYVELRVKMGKVEEYKKARIGLKFNLINVTREVEVVKQVVNQGDLEFKNMLVDQEEKAKQDYQELSLKLEGMS